MRSINLRLPVAALLLAGSAMSTAGGANLSHSQSRHVIYRVALSTSTGDTHVAFFLMWILIAGRTTVVVRWDESDRES